MTFFLRTGKNQTIVDLELWEKNGFTDLRTVVVIDAYSEFLLKNLDKKEEVIRTFAALQELRGWLFEVFNRDNDKSYEEIRFEICDVFMEVADKFNLVLVID